MESQGNQSRAFELAPAGAPVLLVTKIESTTSDDSREGSAAADVCPVCYDLDPILAPKVGSTSWAVLEYNIPATTPVGEITVTKSGEFIQAAEDGCFYCHTIRLALETVHQGWESKPSIVHIYLALGLPVVLGLQFGYMVTESLDRESALRHTGLEIPEGPDRLNVSLAVYYPEHETIELEIYRLRQEQGQCTPTSKPASLCSWLIKPTIRDVAC